MFCKQKNSHLGHPTAHPSHLPSSTNSMQPSRGISPHHPRLLPVPWLLAGSLSPHPGNAAGSPPQHLLLPPASALRCASASRPAAAAAAAALSFSRPYRASKQPATARLSPRQLLYPCSPPQPASAFGKRKRKRKRKPGAPAAGMLPPGGAELGNGDLRSKGFPFSHVLC